jgi:hypothetical protein
MIVDPPLCSLSSEHQSSGLKRHAHVQADRTPDDDGAP